jgi:hypothetical protein
VDLGTEFGLNVEPGGASQLMVFEGEVAVSLLGGDGRPLYCTLVEGPRAVEVNPKGDGIKTVTARPEQFVRPPDAAPTALDLDPDYRGAVLAARPWGYWRFEQLGGGQVPNEVAGRPALWARGGIRLGGPAGGHRWVVFPEGDPAQALLTDGDWTPPRAGGYAVEVWVQPAAPNYYLPGQTALVSAIARQDRPDEQHVSYLELTARSRRSPHEPCTVRFLDRWPADVRGGTDVFSRRTFVPSLWHHVVGQKAGDVLELYIDGELVGTTPAKLNPDEAGAVTRPCRLLVGRLKEHPVDPRFNEIRPFEGRLDELAVYDRPLTPGEIRRHAGLRGPAP